MPSRTRGSGGTPACATGARTCSTRARTTRRRSCSECSSRSPPHRAGRAPMSDGPILVLGASGTIGAALTAQLVQAGRPVRAFFDPSTPQRAAFAEAVEVIHGTFDDDDALRAAADGARAMFLLTPPAAAQVRWQRAAVQAAVTAGVARIVKLSAFDSGPGSP